MGIAYNDPSPGMSPPDKFVEVTMSRHHPTPPNQEEDLLPKHQSSRAHQTEPKEAEFLRSNKTYWQHGVETPYTAFKYYKVNNISTKTRLSKHNDQGVFAPKLVVEPVDHSAFAPHVPVQVSSAPPYTKADVLDQNVCKSDCSDSIFSGHFSIPRVAYNVPSYADNYNSLASTSVPQLCYQNHFDVDDLTFTFGGLCVSSKSNFEHLGLPSSVPLDKISIHFPCELPPFVSKEIITNPFMSQNTAFCVFNAKRGSLTYLDSLDSVNAPGHINSLIPTQISDRHTFFYGGFSIKDESVTYNADIDRWIIHKKFILNKDGYILDRLTYKFSKVGIKEKEGAFKHEGRLGSSIVSNIYHRRTNSNESIARVPSPSIFADTASSQSNPTSPYLKPNQSPKYSHDSFKLPDSNTNIASISAVTTNHEKSESSEAPSAISSVSSFLHSKTRSSPKEKITTQTTTTIRTPAEHSSKGSSVGTSLKTISTNSSSNSGDISSIGISESSGSLHNSPTAGTKTSKMNTVLSKSSRIFHRSHHQRQLSNSTPKSPQPQPHSLKNTYSKQVKQHRSNSQHSSNESRPVSPIQLLQKPKQDNHSKPEIKIEEQATISSPPESRSTTPVSFEKLNTYKPPSFEAAKVKYDESRISEVGSDSTTTDEDLTRKHILFHESILKSGINGVTLFIFGGFCPVEDEKGVLSFVASDQLLKIDLACTEDGKSFEFHNEGMMFDITDSCRAMASDSNLWPSPRGFFAHSLINYNEKHAHCNNDIFHDSDLESLISRRATSPLSSSSGASFRTISSGQENNLAIQGPDKFFKGKALLVQGGCNEEGKTFSGLYLFLFDTGQWQNLNTYCYDYFDYPLGPNEDDDTSRFTKDKELSEPTLIEAELRSCHHTALYYQKEGRDYLFFMGGFRNDILRHFDKTPYVSDKFDVTRLSRFAFVSDNSNVSRIPVLNLQTQTWRFMRYYHDVNHILTDQYVDRVNYNPLWLNARIANFAGSISLNGKSITICHGLAIPCPIKAEDYEAMKKEVPTRMFLWGGHVHFTFPDL